MSIEELFKNLRVDRWRSENPFSADILEAQAVMHHPFAAIAETTEALRNWCRKRQPCNFGRMGAKFGFIHFCILTERDLMTSETALARKIAEEKRLWKQRALDKRNPPHSFMLVFVSPRVALAAPDDNLKRFATHLRDLAGFKPVRSQAGPNPIASDFLYLRNPSDELYYGFKFNLDFFAAAGDGRWWHDHRMPGGVAFTANSTGHMRHWQEWYSEDRGTDRGEFFVENAMYTIAQAHPRKKEVAAAQPAGAPDLIAEGRVTWLRDLDGGKPLKDCFCPFAATPKRLEGKDWTTYEGLLHTDHNIRDEFFTDDPEPATRAKPYLMDFTYLYDKREADYVQFMAGVRLAQHEVFAEIGAPHTWTVRGSIAEPDAVVSRSATKVAEVRQLLEVCERWTDAPDLISSV